MQVFASEKMLYRKLELLSGKKLPNRNEENPALVLSNVHNRTSARDGPMFGSKGISMYV
jgi:hypothetical protein